MQILKVIPSPKSGVFHDDNLINQYKAHLQEKHQQKVASTEVSDNCDQLVRARKWDAVAITLMWAVLGALNVWWLAHLMTGASKGKVPDQAVIPFLGMLIFFIMTVIYPLISFTNRHCFKEDKFFISKWMRKRLLVEVRANIPDPNQTFDLTRPEQLEDMVDFLWRDVTTQKQEIQDNIHSKIRKIDHAIWEINAIRVPDSDPDVAAAQIEQIAQTKEQLEQMREKLGDQYKRAETALAPLSDEVKKLRGYFTNNRTLQRIIESHDLMTEVKELIINNEEWLQRIESKRNDSLAEMKAINEMVLGNGPAALN